MSLRILERAPAPESAAKNFRIASALRANMSETSSPAQITVEGEEKSHHLEPRPIEEEETIAWGTEEELRRA
jgi:hypothetical protein